MGRYGKAHAPFYLKDTGNGEPPIFLQYPLAYPATNIQYLTFQANWEAFPGATGYIIEVAFDSNFENKVPGYISLTIGNVINLTISVPFEGSNYYYRIRAITPFGITGYSNTIGLITLFVSHQVIYPLVYDAWHAHHADNFDLILPVGYGLHYNWFAVNTGKLAPAGWHIPTLIELQSLMLQISANPAIRAAMGIDAKVSGWRTGDSGAFQWKDIIGWLGSVSYVGYGSWQSYEIIGGSTSSYQYSLLDHAGVSLRHVKDDSTDPGVINDYEGNNYYTYKIQATGKVWITQNWKSRYYNDGTPVPEIIDNAAWIADSLGARCEYPA